MKKVFELLNSMIPYVSVVKKTTLKNMEEVFNKSINMAYSWAQDGEDIILDKYLSAESPGFYVDVGAHHPERFSNTKLFYDRGWCGINIEPNPDQHNIFMDRRGHDINLNIGIGSEPGSFNYYRYDEPALNTFSDDRVKYLKENTSYTLIDVIDVPVKKLSDVIEGHCRFRNLRFDFLTVDVEGLDFDVLSSNDWGKFRPRFIICEITGLEIQDALNCDIVAYLNKVGYKLIAKTYYSGIFETKDFTIFQ